MGEDIYYIVKKGDSLYAIASKYNTTVAEIKKLNNLTNNNLSIGQKLLIKKVTTDGNTYMVQKGDSLYSIAQKFNTTVDNLKAANNLATDVLSIGQVLVIPESEVSSNNNENTYIVQSGDTLYGIANKYNTTVDEIKKRNNLTNNTLSIGMLLYIPNNNEKIYTVENGDTLYSIARKFNTTVSSLVELNNLASNLLSIGQKLLIP